jgi:hypothetical protein
MRQFLFCAIDQQNKKSSPPSGANRLAAGQISVWCMMTRFLNYDTKGREQKTSGAS